MSVRPSALRGRVAIPLLLTLLWPVTGTGQTAAPRDLTEASLEDLMNIQVTSVSKKGQKLSKAGAAVFVITGDDIRRSGATNIPDLLRMAPGVNVARVDANRWAVSIRGFNQVYGNKVLVLIDGRSVYLDAFSGVFWDQQDVLLENIDRIEVIRGPGGTVWGANAVNGVINIITKSAKDSQGNLVTAGAGSQTTADASEQRGGRIGSNGAYRVFGRYFSIGNSLYPNGQRAADGWHGSQGGFRADWDPTARDSVTVQGGLSQTAEGQNKTEIFPEIPLQTTLNESITNGLGDVLGRWTHTLAGGSQTSLQVYHNYVHRTGEVGDDEQYHSTDLDFQDHVAVGTRQDLVWGLNYRFNHAILNTVRPYGVTFLPSHRSDNLFAAFLQDEIRITSTVSVTLGSKVEHNTSTGLGIEPSVQLVWTPSSLHTLWISASRAIRQPSLLEHGVHVNLAILPLGGSDFAIQTLFGDRDLKAETLREHEVGYRTHLSRRLSLDVTGFLSYYHNLRTEEPEDPFFTTSPGPPHVVLPLRFDFEGKARNYGAEVSANWTVTGRWKVSSGYSWLRMGPQTTEDSIPEKNAGDSPRHQFQVRSFFNLPRGLDWDSSAMYVSTLTNGPVPSYVRVDTRLGWRVGESLEFSIVGQDLLSPRHAEFVNAAFITPTLVKRSVFGKFTWRF